MKCADIRKNFLNFFEKQGHQVVPSSSLVPASDPTLLFTNAGMVQFKDVFLGKEQRNYHRAASSQRCVRAGGKHNDLENVGYTARHHTFFEMLGNFSFGDYFKQDAIKFAWEFLVNEMKLSPQRLWVTVYQDDDEAARIWLEEIKVDPKRFSRIGDKPGKRKYESDNFWSMGDTGPCGPCSEIFYDHGPEIAGGPPGSPDEDGDRYIEIWNLVFMQFDRAADGEMKPLPKPSVDTGMGLERLAAVMQGVHNNYEIDLFANLIKFAAKLANTSDLSNKSLRVIADHIRSCAFMITDGVVPSNEGRGYVLRRIIRRAIRHGHKLGLRDAFFYKLVKPLVQEMGDAFPELAKAQANVERVLQQEEQRFEETLDQGMSILDEAIRNMKGKVLNGDTVFKLYDTYGFPVDLTADIARERDLQLDMDGFEKAMASQRERARKAGKFEANYHDKLDVKGATVFTGYDGIEGEGTVLQLFKDGSAVKVLSTGDDGIVVLDRTPFYAESGGQVGDQGRLDAKGASFLVQDTQKQHDVYLHMGRVDSGQLKVGDKIKAAVNQSERRQTACNHSATHLFHAALRQVLGTHVTQKGSLVDAERLRFDFSHFEPVSAQQLTEIEDLVNEKIRANYPVQTKLMQQDEAIAAGAMALFGEKYGDVVRVLSMGDFSVELCGGTHVNRTGDIGMFKIISEAGVAAGVRRVEAISGVGAMQWLHGLENNMRQLASLVKGTPDTLNDKIKQLLERNRQVEKELEQLKGKLASSQGSDLMSQAQDIEGIKVLAARLDGVDPKSLRDTLDQLKNKLGSAAIVLAAVNDDKINLVAGVTNDQTSRIKAGNLVNVVAQQVGGKGGGRPDMAMAGGNNPAALDNALDSVPNWIREQLASLV